MLAGTHILGYHCTRLHDDEIAKVLGDGLKPLCGELVRERIQTRVRSNNIPGVIGSRLLEYNEASMDNRKGKIWFVFTEPLLKEEAGIDRFFRNWGGECLYNNYEDDHEIGPLLRAIGYPCIVQASVPAASIETFCPIAERFLRLHLSRRKIRTGHNPEFEGYVRHSVKVLQIIRSMDPEFKHLTGCESWANHLC